MDIRCFAEIEIKQDEPVAAIRQFVGVLRHSATRTDKAKIELSLIGTSARAASTIKEFNPDRTGTASFDDALAITEELTHLTPAKISSLNFNLHAEGFGWKGAPKDCSCFLHLFDMKVFQRRQRFSMTAMMDFRAADPKSADVANMLARIQKATGIAFNIEASAIQFEPADTGKATPEQFLVATLAWNECIQVVAEKVRKAVTLAGIPKLMSPRESLNYRFDPAHGRSVRVDFRKIVSRWAKQNFPDYVSKKGFEDGLRFSKQLNTDLILDFVVDKKPRAFSKNFSVFLQMGLTSPAFATVAERPFTLSTNLFTLFQVGPLPMEWVYVDEADLDSALRGAHHLLSAVLPLVEAEICHSMHDVRRRAIDEFEGPRELTAREAYNLVIPSARSWASDASLLRLQCHPILIGAGAHALDFPVFTKEGRLATGGRWRLSFHSSGLKKVLDVYVPYRGRVVYMSMEDDMGSRWPRDAELTIPEGWIDSGIALKLAYAKAGEKGSPADGGGGFDLCSRIGLGTPKEISWRVHIGKKNEKGGCSIAQITVPAYGDDKPSMVVHNYDHHGRAIDD